MGISGMTEYRKYWNERMETLSSDEYQEVQSKALLKELGHVWQNSVFYQEKFGEAGVELGDIKGIEDLNKLPFTEKRELRESLESARPLGKHAVIDISKVIRIYSTSGTTGTPTYIGLTNHDRKIWRETANRAMWTCGMRPHHIVPLPIGTFFIAASYGEAIESLGATLVPVGVGATDRLIGACKNLGANYILSTTSFPLYLINYCQKKGIDPKDLGVKGFMLGGEPGAGIPHIRQQIEEAFGANVQETMGNGDMLGLMWAECEFKSGIHFIGQGACHSEIIDPDTGEVLEITKGTKGEMIYTSLDRECQPLIRFRTRDHVEVTQTTCECGRTGYCIRCIGRTDDMLIISGVNVYPSAIRDVISGLTPRVTGEILIQLQEPPPSVRPPMIIKVEHGEEIDDPAQLKSDIEKLLREKLIFSSKVELVPPGTLPKYEYKAKLVEKTYEM
jgi:phenylacetate-CoA ligase